MKSIKSIVFSSLLVYGTLSAAVIDIPVHYDTLANGLRVIIVPDTNAAVVSCRLYYFMGSMYEGPGTSGLSHLYEHMFFKGTKILGTLNYAKEKRHIQTIDSLETLIFRLQQNGAEESDSSILEYRAMIFSQLEAQRALMKKDEIWELYLNNGGTNLNAWTGDDMTAYIVTLPQNKIELFCWIEADRMRNPVLRELYSERDVVTEERRMRYENRPLNKYYEILNAHFFIAHPYRIPTIGWMSDLRTYTTKKLNDHVNRYYTPDNALLIFVGNVVPAEVMRLVSAYFLKIPRSKTPKEEVVTREPPPIGETRFIMHDDAQPRIDLMYHTPGYPNNDLYKLDVIEGMLSGRSGRLYQRLVNKEKLCIDAGASNEFKLHNGVFHVWALPATGADPARIESAILDELKRLQAFPPSAREMERIKNGIEKYFVSSLTSLEGLSDQLASFERLNTWKDLLEYPGKIDSVTPASISGIARTYLNPGFRTVGMLLPKEKTSHHTASQGEDPR